MSSADAVADRRAVSSRSACRGTTGPVADPDGVRDLGRVLDGAGEPVPDALVETWQPEPAAFARCATDDDGRWHVVCPRRPTVAVHVFARGLLRHLTTRICFDESTRRPGAARAGRPARHAARPSATDDGYRSTSGSRARTRPSSSTSELFGGIYARGAVAAAVDDEAWVQAMLDVEAALGERAAAAARRSIDIAPSSGRRARPSTPRRVVPLARRFEAHARRARRPRTSLDTAMMLVAKRALEPLLDDAAAAARCRRRAGRRASRDADDRPHAAAGTRCRPRSA